MAVRTRASFSAFPEHVACCLLDHYVQSEPRKSIGHRFAFLRTKCSHCRPAVGTDPVQTGDPNDQTHYGPMLQKFTDPRNIRIALIPLLKDKSECEPIRDQTNAGYCRWMNKYQRS
jgi:hypothetical protein